MNWNLLGFADQQLALANRQLVTSFCISDSAECRRMFQIGDWRVLIADPFTPSETAPTGLLSLPAYRFFLAVFFFAAGREPAFGFLATFFLAAEVLAAL